MGPQYVNGAEECSLLMGCDGGLHAYGAEGSPLIRFDGGLYGYGTEEGSLLIGCDKGLYVYGAEGSLLMGSDGSSYVYGATICIGTIAANQHIVCITLQATDWHTWQLQQKASIRLWRLKRELSETTTELRHPLVARQKGRSTASNAEGSPSV